MSLNLFDVPGFKDRYEAALKTLFTRRDAAFCSLNLVDIAGLEFRPLTLRSIVDLCIANNRVMLQHDSEDWTLSQIAIFLWRLSPDYPDQKKKRRHFKRLEKINPFDLRLAVSEYVKGVFEDSPKGGNSNRKEIPYASYSAFLVDLFSREYCWSLDEIMDTPYDALMQLQRVITKRLDPKVTFRPPFAEMRREALTKLNTLKSAADENGKQ
jgi:hypothetical protein